jgi:polysaccharide export outer membrane protein
MTKEATVSAKGTISYFLIGDLQASGLTRFQLRDKVEKELAKYGKDPKVFIDILSYQSHKVFVLGQVNKPGVYRMRGNFTLLEAVSSAGGITPNAYLNGAHVVRGNEVLLVNFFELIEQGNTEENIPLKKGDVVYIPDSRERKIYVLGEVKQQSAIPIRGRLNLLGAIAEAGGFNHDADTKAVMVMRGNLSKPEVMEIDATYLDLAGTFPLEQGDIVYVGSTASAKAERAAIRISHILRPYLDVMRGIMFTDVAIDVLRGEVSEELPRRISVP